MTDRELLELAARAAGITLETSYDINGEYWPWSPEYSRNWCPLTDDGDALRLAVKLELSVYVNRRMINVTHSMRPFTELEIVEDDPTDPYAATRLAIVRAAAEIGKGMK